MCVCVWRGERHLSQHSCLLWPIGVTRLPLAVSCYLPHVSGGRGAAGWPRAPQSLVWPWPSGRGTISSSQAAMRPCLEQCLFLLNLERLSDAALPPERTLFFCCCCVRTRGEYRLREGTKRSRSPEFIHQQQTFIQLWRRKGSVVLL